MEAQNIAQKDNKPVKSFKYSNRVVLKSIVGRADCGLGLVGERVVVGGWVKWCNVKTKPVASKQPAAVPVVKDVTCSELLMSKIPLLRCIAKAFAGATETLADEKPDVVVANTASSIAQLRINDGSCVAKLQVVVDSSVCPLEQVTTIGNSVLVEGVIEKVEARGNYIVELKVEKILHVGLVDHENYPLSKTRLSLDMIRAYPHLRQRTTMVASVVRIRSTLTCAIHMFFQQNGFHFVHTPIITTTTTEDHKKKFYVTNLFSKSDDNAMKNAMKGPEEISLEVLRAAIKDKSRRIDDLKRTDSNKEALIASLNDLKMAYELTSQLENQEKSESMNARKVDFSEDFFCCPAYLTSYAGLHLESHACALSCVYTFGPIFQAEYSKPMTHLAEMWMLEVELAFAMLEDVMNCAEDCLKSLCLSIQKDCSDDIKFLSSRKHKRFIDRIKSVESHPFARISYTEALEVLKKVTDKVEWGMDLSTEHQSYLADEYFKRPLIINEYPKELKPFYARIRDDRRTVSAFDIIVPKAGVIASGSQKEERIDMLDLRIQELGLPREQLDWYLDIRRHGTVEHAGFNVKFEKLIMFVTGIDDIRDVIPFPRTRGDARC
ncbi:asparagine--tRNA ligase, cytoplasmic 2 [Typha latifolia]|uniref:asparagine--tRNA ligase, cytoplasmic 2 n=1 Tax=Typha latifolia TaxID=4733 RepID=UPI003C2D1A68